MRDVEEKYASHGYLGHTPVAGIMPGGPRDGGGVAAHIARHDPARVLAEVAAKRAIVALHVLITKVAFDQDDEPVVDGGYCDLCQTTDGCPDGDWPCDTLKLLAAPYNQHPDYDPAWSVE